MGERTPIVKPHYDPDDHWRISRRGRVIEDEELQDDDPDREYDFQKDEGEDE